MNDDRKFVAAIFAAIGDAVPRLAYADWLDERAQDRGEATPTPFAAYLRRAATWAVGGEQNRITDFVCLRYQVPPEEITVAAMGGDADRERYFVPCKCGLAPQPDGYADLLADPSRFAVAALMREQMEAADGGQRLVWHGLCAACGRIHTAAEEEK